MKKSGALRAIVTTGLVVGVLDISSAFVIWWQRGVTIQRGLQGIADGLLGAKSYGGDGNGRPRSCAPLLRCVCGRIDLLAASRKIPFLTKHPFLSGVFYGTGVYIVMYWFVLPTAFSTFRHRLSNDGLVLAIHISLIGLPTAFIVRRYSQLTEQSS